MIENIPIVFGSLSFYPYDFEQFLSSTCKRTPTISDQSRSSWSELEGLFNVATRDEHSIGVVGVQQNMTNTDHADDIGLSTF